jgi:hypothetical protein
MTGGPEWNRTTTYGFGGHRPIHWTTGPESLHSRWKGVTGRAGLGKDKDLESHAVPRCPEGGGLCRVWDDF